MSDESPAVPAVANDAGDSRIEATEPKATAPEASSDEPALDKDTGKAPASEDKPTDAAPAETPTEATAPTESADANGKPEGEPAPVESQTPAVNGTPAKKADSSKRKSIGGAASAKKKKSQPRVTHLDAQPGEYYLARLKSFPPWPAIICDEEMLPQTLLTTRPVTTKQSDGTYREPYNDGGKRVYDRTFPIMFLETNEFAWIPNTDLTPLDPETCKDVSEKGKQKHLAAAYKVAAESHDLQYFKGLLADHQRAVQQEFEDREAAAAEKAALKAQKDAEKEEKKKKRKSVAEGTDVDMGDGDDDKKAKSAKKRKKDAESDAEGGKPAKTPKTAQKLKLSTPKDPATAEKAAKSSKSKAPKGEEQGASTPKQTPKPIDPQEAKERKEKEILFIRHRLQKVFISRDQAPKEEEMPLMSDHISKLEKHANLEVSIIRKTKIHKVLKAIVKLNSIPKDEEFHFKRRSMDILSKWKNVLESDAQAGGADDSSKEKETKPKTNGVHRQEDKAEADKTEVENAAAKEETPLNAEEEKDRNNAEESKDEPMPDAEPEATEKTQAPEPVQEPEPETTPAAATPSVETKPTEVKSESAVDATA